jgi:hypothetical protein
MKIALIAAIIVGLFIPAMAADTVTEKTTNTTFDKTKDGMELLGVAPRLKNILGIKVKVYGVGLYADKAAMDAKIGTMTRNTTIFAAALKSMSGKRAIVMKFVRDLDNSVMSGAFTEGIEMSMPIDDPRIAEDAKVFLAAFVPIKSGDTATLVFEGDRLSLYDMEKELVSVENRDLSRAIMSTYIGSNPVDPSVKKNLLKDIK